MIRASLGSNIVASTKINNASRPRKTRNAAGNAHSTAMAIRKTAPIVAVMRELTINRLIIDSLKALAKFENFSEEGNNVGG